MPNIVTPAEIMDLIGLAVDSDDIRTAQFVISTVADVDLSDGYLVRYRSTDLSRLKEAVAWELLYLQQHPEVLTEVSNVVQASANGASITFKDGATSALSPLSDRTLDRLSWRREANGVQVTTLRAAPPNSRPVQPDPWIVVSAGGSL